jgi:transcription elongation factor GreA
MQQSPQTYLTQEGRVRLQQELDQMETVRRREVADELKTAAEVGGTVDNAEYDEAKRNQDAVERRIMDLENLLRSAINVPEHEGLSDTVEIGSQVQVENEQGARSEYTIVGSAEADPLHGRISNESPVGQALLGKRVGEQAQARAPQGTVKLKVVSIR